MRLPYTNPVDYTFSSPKAPAMISRIEARRALRPFSALDLTLLHLRDIADGWNSSLGTVRTKTTLSEDIKEISIRRVAIINQALIGWSLHAPLVEAGGLSAAGMKILKERKDRRRKLSYRNRPK